MTAMSMATMHITVIRTTNLRPRQRSPFRRAANFLTEYMIDSSTLADAADMARAEVQYGKSRKKSASSTSGWPRASRN
jgi:hypothetical protein